MGLKIHGQEFNHVEMSASETERVLKNCKIRNYTFEVEASYTYLVRGLHNAGQISEEINKKLITANRANTDANKKLFRSKIIYQSTIKMKLYIPVTRSAVIQT